MNIDNKELSALLTNAVAEGITRANHKAYKGDTMTFDSLMQEWLEYKSIRVTANTIGKYTMLYNKHVKPVFGDTPLTSITKKMLQSFINMLNETYSIETVKAIKSEVLNAPLKYAYDEDQGYIPKNPCENVIAPKRTFHNHKTAVSDEDIRKLRTVSDRHRLWIIVPLLYNTGMRRGEMLALRWDDIDFDKRSISISKSYTIICGTGETVLKEPKTQGSVRYVPIFSTLMPELQRYREQEGTRSPYVLTSLRSGGMLYPKTINNLIKQWADEAGVKRDCLSPHTLGRHTLATALHKQGASSNEIMQVTGHTDTRTLERYYLDRDRLDSPVMSRLSAWAGVAFGGLMDTKKPLQDCL